MQKKKEGFSIVTRNTSNPVKGGTKCLHYTTTHLAKCIIYSHCESRFFARTRDHYKSRKTANVQQKFSTSKIPQLKNMQISRIIEFMQRENNVRMKMKKLRFRFIFYRTHETL